jgi:hypothetical protein
MCRNTDNSLLSRWCFLALIGLAPLLAGTRTPLPDGRDFQTYLTHLRELKHKPKPHAAAHGANRSREILGNHR